MAFFQAISKDFYQECPGFCVKGMDITRYQTEVKKFPQQNLKPEETELLPVVYKGLQAHKADLSCTWVLHISDLCWITLWSSHWALPCLGQNWRQRNLSEALFIPWTYSSHIALIRAEVEVQTPDFNFPEMQGIQLQDFYLSLSVAWLQGKEE